MKNVLSKRVRAFQSVNDLLDAKNALFRILASHLVGLRRSILLSKTILVF